MIAAWGGFGLFTILAGVVVLYCDRLAQRRRMAAMADFFAHLLDLPASFHAETHSGRLTKIMLDGPNAMFGLWLTFFREHCATFVALFVTLPATLALNVRFGLVLIALVAFFGVAMNYVIRRVTINGIDISAMTLASLRANIGVLLQAALASARAGRTTFIIAHRLSTIRNADVILVFDRGRIVEAGGFADLVARDGAFARLARAQSFAAPANAG